MQEHIYVSGPSITQKEIDYVTDAVTNAWYGNANVFNKRFEDAFAAYHGVKFAVALPSCTAAIHLALLALNIHEGDEVIVPELTWIASSAPISYVGATPIFADVDTKTWCLSAESFEKCITPRTKAVITVDLYGNVPDMDAIRTIANQHSIAIIEDAAEAVGASYKGHKAGSLGEVGVFSFHGSKTLTTGEGGMLITNNDTLYERVLFYRDHGRRPGDKLFWNHEVAYKYKMSSMQAALGLAQLERIDELVERKRTIFANYEEQLSGIAGITLNYEAPDTTNVYWMVTAIVDSKFGFDKETLGAALAKRDIDTRPFFYPLSAIPAYADTPQAQGAKDRNPVSYSISPYGINLPCGMDMTEEKIAYVCDALKECLLVSHKV
ncbi:MAG: aminotransferase class I/II-fold pyridoxal phosphate-dependent enzyme [Anaerolineaceae bacterium]|nr:aminotransferase class I/II-fold pyridoxal phosphate-dependent enzyme [Anaerolineaceae bacterium]